MSETLSAFPFYGGKAKMASFICDMLDYDNTDIYIEPFGGGCRTLLNKPRHEVEIYNDSSAGLASIMYCLSNWDTAKKFIEALYDTVYNEECFCDKLEYRNNFEDDYLSATKGALRRFVARMEKKYNRSASDEFKKALRKNLETESLSNSCFNGISLLNEEQHTFMSLCKSYSFVANTYQKEYDKIMSAFAKKNDVKGNWVFKTTVDDYKKSVEYIRQHIDNEAAFENDIDKLDKVQRKEEIKAFEKEFKRLAKEFAYREAQTVIENYHEEKLGQEDIIELAVSTFVVQAQSRDGAGKTWSDCKFKTNDEYYNYIGRLYDIAERLNGVKVFSIDAMQFFRTLVNNECINRLSNDDLNLMKSVNDGVDISSDQKKHINSILKSAFFGSAFILENPRVMLYLDPTYLQQKSEIEDKQPKGKSKDVGKPGYKQSWDQNQHEEFLHIIRDAKCHILLSNYDDKNMVYQRILVDDNSDKTKWKRLNYETTTTVSSGKGDNKRTEVLWYNY